MREEENNRYFLEVLRPESGDEWQQVGRVNGYRFEIALRLENEAVIKEADSIRIVVESKSGDYYKFN